MADYLIVHVIGANLPSSSSTSPISYFVMLRYNDQNHTTSVKQNNVSIQNEKIFFHRQAQADDSGDHTLEAKIYNSGSRSLLGSVLLYDADAARHSDNVVAIRYPLEGANGGKLILKLFLAAADELQHHIFDHVFATEDLHSEGNNVDQQHPPISLQSVDAIPREISPNFEPGKMVERMQHLFVRVIKARRLPDVDANGGLDPYVEVTYGAWKGVTKCLKRNKNPEWNETFAFPFQHGRESCSSVDVVVNDKDLVRDDFVGKLCFDVTKIPVRSPDDIALEPTWYPLLDHQGRKTLGHASLLVAIWIGSQDDQAYRRQARVSPYRARVYETPRLWCLRVTVYEAQGIRVADGKEVVVFCKACLGDLIQKTKAVGRQMTGSYAWNEDLLFAAAEPFFEGDLVVSVIATDPGHGEDETIIGTVTIPLASIDKRANDDDHHLKEPQRFGLKNPALPHLLLEDDSSVDDGNTNSHMHICLLNLLEGGYHIGPDDSHGYTDDTRPADRNLWHPPIGSVHLGILRAVGLTRTGNAAASSGDGKPTPNPYCVAKYGDKWARTHTVFHGPEHVFNEQYTWDIYDLATVLDVGVFDQFMQKDCGHRKIGNVRIHLSSLETHRIYAHSYIHLSS